MTRTGQDVNATARRQGWGWSTSSSIASELTNENDVLVRSKHTVTKVVGKTYGCKLEGTGSDTLGTRKCG